MNEIDVTQVLHDTRTAYLRDLDVVGKTMISVGANGAWYFDWIHTNSGYPERHIGVEFYCPEPDDLPANVEWVANTAGDLHSIDDAVADILFSGQNIEHLWEVDVVGFMLEANRVLRSGGKIVVDSPNRAITQALCIVHPEHMVEIVPDEVESLLNAAGFTVTARRGIYLCRDPRSGGVLPYQPTAMQGGNWSLTERVALADAHVDDSYIWWFEATKIGSADAARLRSLVRRHWEIGWPERMNRLMSAIGTQGEDADGPFFQSSPGVQGAVIYGPYAPLKPGRYRVSARVALVNQIDPTLVVGTLDVVLNANDVAVELPIKAADLSVGQYRTISAEFETRSDIAFGFQWRLIANGGCGLKVEKQTRLEKIL